MRWRLVDAVVHTTEWPCVGPVATTPGSVLSGNWSNLHFFQPTEF
jgi:hypothetical protein